MEKLSGVINGLSAVCHEANIKWWQDINCDECQLPIGSDDICAMPKDSSIHMGPKGHQFKPKTIQRNKGELIALMHSELSEALEGSRKDLMDDKLPHRKMEEVELADALIRIFDYAGGFGLDLGSAFVEKMEYNATRKDHTHEERVNPGGKKF